MTRKETLLLENYRLTNELNTLKGRTDKIVDIDLLLSKWKFNQEAKESTIAGLTYSNDILRKAIESEKQEQERKAAAEAFYATPEGLSYRVTLETEKAGLEKSLTDCMENHKDFFKSWIKGYLGEHWTLRYLWDSHIEFAIVDPKDENQLVFGQTIEIYFDKNYWDKKERFETNVGTTGSFNLLESEQGDRARFYIDFGKFLAGKKELAELKELLFGYRESLDNMRQRILNIEKELENPTSL